MHQCISEEQEQEDRDESQALRRWCGLTEHRLTIERSGRKDPSQHNHNKGIPWWPGRGPHLQNRQNCWDNFGIDLGTQDCAFSTSSQVRFWSRLWKAFRASAGTIRGSWRCSGACNLGGELDVAHFDIDAVTEASKVSFWPLWEPTGRSFGPSDGTNSQGPRKEARSSY